MTSTDQVRDAFVERLFASALGTMDVFTVYLGDRLGLYRMLAAHGPLTAGELAERAGMYARYARAPHSTSTTGSRFTPCATTPRGISRCRTSRGRPIARSWSAAPRRMRSTSSMGWLAR